MKTRQASNTKIHIETFYLIYLTLKKSQAKYHCNLAFLCYKSQNNVSVHWTWTRTAIFSEYTSQTYGRAILYEKKLMLREANEFSWINEKRNFRFWLRNSSWRPNSAAPVLFSSSLNFLPVKFSPTWIRKYVTLYSHPLWVWTNTTSVWVLQWVWIYKFNNHAHYSPTNST